MTVSGIRFTPEQARVLAQVPPETVRHWRKRVPYLSQLSGKAPRFTLSDVLALAITAQLVRGFGAGIANIAGAIDSLFRSLAAVRVSELHDAVVLLTPEQVLVRARGEDLFALSEGHEPLIIIDCRVVLEKMQDRVLPGLRADVQPGLPFLPQAVRRS